MTGAAVIVWFRQDLRLGDHPALTAAASVGVPVIPLFVLDDETPGDRRLGGASRWWLAHSLRSLAKSLKAIKSRLILRRGKAEEILLDLARETGAHAVHATRMVEPWARAMDHRLGDRLAKHGATFELHNGALLFEPGTIRTEAGGVFRVYTPFARAALKASAPRKPIKAPRSLQAPSHWPASETLDDWQLLPKHPDWAGGLRSAWTSKFARGEPGEEGAQAHLEHFLSAGLKHYARDRDRPSIEGTSRLSPHLHFGEISPNSVWWAVRAYAAAHRGQEDGLDKFLKEMLWREFSHHLLVEFFNLPEEPFRAEFRAFPWRKDAAAFRTWTKGETGYPIVDAGLRELWTTGYMHNRVRLIAASFLVKHLLIPWQQGERWFWDTLVDADLANNAANWQWVAGCGADAAPYFRIFNPMLQGAKFDPEGDYVRRWVPELKDVPVEHIHTPFEAPPLILSAAGVKLGKTYPEPIVDHAAARQRALDAFDRVKAS